MEPISLLSLIVFLPALAALALLVFPKEQELAMKRFALGATAAVFLLTAWMATGGGEGRFDTGVAKMQNMFSVDWIPSFNIFYHMGTDGISFSLLVLTSFISMLSMWASWPINKHVKAYLILFLLLETGMLGVFMSLDFFLFYVFWEVMLLPMYFLIGVWGGPRKEYAAIKFFLYTLFGSVLMLIAILMLYFSSDVKGLNVAQLQSTHVVSPDITGDKLAEELKAVGFREAEISLLTKNPEQSVNAQVHEMKEFELPREQLHTFNILALQQIGQHTKQFSAEDANEKDQTIFGSSIQMWAFVLLFIGFIIKVPSFPFHTWLPDAHVEAPTPISMILAGVLLKMGGYGIIRICYPICPEAAYALSGWVCGLGVASMVYGAFAAMAQTDFKRLVAYSSVSHMGYVLLGLGVASATFENGFDSRYWAMGMNGAMFQMLGHGISSAGMFFMVGVIYDRVHHRNLNEFGGLFAKMPVYCGLSMGIFFAGLGLPGLCGFIGEVMVTLSVWNYSRVLAVISAFVVILTAGYILWTIQRVYLGAEYKGPHADAIVPTDFRERAIGGTLLAFAILFGVYPQAIFNYMQPSVTQTAKDLAAWKKANPDETAKPAMAETEKETASDEVADVAAPSPEDSAAVEPRRAESDNNPVRVATALPAFEPHLPSIVP
jgi:NADH-quinone oxidoreductase subunit M